MSFQFVLLETLIAVLPTCDNALLKELTALDVELKLDVTPFKAVDTEVILEDTELITDVSELNCDTKPLTLAPTPANADVIEAI